MTLGLNCSECSRKLACRTGVSFQFWVFLANGGKRETGTSHARGEEREKGTPPLARLALASVRLKNAKTKKKLRLLCRIAGNFLVSPYWYATVIGRKAQDPVGIQTRWKITIDPKKVSRSPMLRPQNHGQ